MATISLSFPRSEILECRLAQLVDSVAELLERLDEGRVTEEEAENLDALAAQLHEACLAVGSKRNRAAR